MSQTATTEHQKSSASRSVHSRRGTKANPIKPPGPPYLYLRLVFPPRKHADQVFSKRPAKSLKCELESDGEIIAKGSTNPEGIVKLPVPGDLTAATLHLIRGDKRFWSVDLKIGVLDPKETRLGEPFHIAGEQARLNNLGLYAGEPSSDDTSEKTLDMTVTAMEEFRVLAGLEEKSELGPRWDRLVIEHGGKERRRSTW